MAVRDHDSHWTWDVSGAQAVFTSREGGASPAPLDSLNVGLHVGDDPVRVLENRRRVAALLDLDPGAVAGVTQVHGADVWLDLARGAQLPAEVRWDGGPSPIEADALVTTRADVALAVGVADCLPIAVAWGDAITAIHAGWRSLEQGIIEAALTVLRRAAGPAVALADSHPRAVIGPCLGTCCMEVGEDVAARFDPASIVRHPGDDRAYLDAGHDARRRLLAAGCVVERIDVCTRHDPRCFSHRGDAGRGGRQAMLVRRVEG